MSTLSIVTPGVVTPGMVTPESDVDTHFDALVRTLPTQRDRRADAGFETVFDLDYAQSLPGSARVVTQPRARRVRSLAQQPSGAVRLTRRGRLVLVLAFLAIAVALMIPMGGWATATLTGGTPEPVRVVEVGPGDTLYGIAADLAEPGEIRAMVHRIQELNSLPGGQITEGQKLAVPRG